MSSPEPEKLIPRTSPKKARRPQWHTQKLWDAITAIVDEYDRLSVRQLYYQLVSRGVIEKTEAQYKRVCDASAQMRINGALDYRKIVDGHRVRRGVFSHDGLADALETAHEMYRRNYWIDQPRHIEVWSEKDALTGVIHPVCDAYGITYVATRGFPSITLIYESAAALSQIVKPTTIFYFGDHDASGQQISANLEGDLQAHGADVTVRRMALNPDQVRAYALPTRPGKRSDSRHAKFERQFGDASVELDALPPNVLTQMVRQAIVTEIDVAQWNAAMEIEALERQTLESIARIHFEPGTQYTFKDDAA